MEDERLEELLDRARGRDRSERLVQVIVRGVSDGTSLWYWTSNRIRADVQEGTAHVTRRYGKVGDGRGLALGLEELRRIAVVCEVWERTRHEWAAFFASSAGMPGGYGRSYYYQPPGARAQLVQIGRSVMGRRHGGELVGRDDRVRLPKAERLAPNVRAVEEVWRRGEAHGPPDGSLVGRRYTLGGGLAIDAQREHLRIARARRELFLEKDEAPFVRALVDVLSRDER
ncbi:MAG: hypothetical protein M3Y87_18330 [Myxococcota bacterium]|nr:hypothetical protein [Myxococcota bacterium]